MLDIIDKIVEVINSCFSRVACQCHTHLCSCCDLSVDVIRKSPLGKSYSKYFEEEKP